jgi:hypothetical protein
MQGTQASMATPLQVGSLTLSRERTGLVRSRDGAKSRGSRHQSRRQYLICGFVHPRSSEAGALWGTVRGTRPPGKRENRSISRQ